MTFTFISVRSWFGFSWAVFVLPFTFYVIANGVMMSTRFYESDSFKLTLGTLLELHHRKLILLGLEILRRL